MCSDNCKSLVIARTSVLIKRANHHFIDIIDKVIYWHLWFLFMVCVECALGALLLIIVLAIFAYLLPKEAKGIKSLPKVTGDFKNVLVSCLLQQGLENQRHGSAQIRVLSRYHYDSFTGKTVCDVMDITVNITGANPNTPFYVFAGYRIFYGDGGVGEDNNWEHLASGTTDSSGSLTINTGTVNPTENYEVQVVVAVIDATCENLLIQSLSPTLCSRAEEAKQSRHSRHSSEPRFRPRRSASKKPFRNPAFFER